MFSNNLLDKVLTPEETASLEQRMNTKIATHAPAILLEFARQNSKDITALRRWKTIPGSRSKQRWKEFERILKEGQELPDANGDKGKFFNLQELSDVYQRLNGRLPDEQEVSAYFAFVRNVEMDHVLRNLRIYTNKARVGAEAHSLGAIDPKSNKVIQSDYFDGMLHNWALWR
jgi:hypothetical protein